MGGVTLRVGFALAMQEAFADAGALLLGGIVAAGGTEALLSIRESSGNDNHDRPFCLNKFFALVAIADGQKKGHSVTSGPSPKQKGLLLRLKRARVGLHRSSILGSTVILSVIQLDLSSH